MAIYASLSDMLHYTVENIKAFKNSLEILFCCTNLGFVSVWFCTLCSYLNK